MSNSYRVVSNFPDHSSLARCLRTMRSPPERQTARGARGNRVIIAPPISGHHPAIRLYSSLACWGSWQLCPPTGCHRTHLIDTLHDVDDANRWTVIKPHVARAIGPLPVLTSVQAGAPDDGQPQWWFYTHECPCLASLLRLAANVLPRWNHAFFGGSMKKST